MTKTADTTLVPELLVADIDRSLEFWCGLCGFTISYSRPDERFAYIAQGAAHLMLDQLGVGRDWVTGSLERPLGRGVNFQIRVPDTASLAATLEDAAIGLFIQPETRWYRVGRDEVGVHQFLVQDPDGYLVRFQSTVGRRQAVR